MKKKIIFDTTGKKKTHTYQKLLPQFFLVRSISFGVNLITFLMLITGRALGGQNYVSNSVAVNRDLP